MVCAPQSRALPAPYSPKPWGHRECVYSTASLKVLSSVMASKEEKSVFSYCLVLVSLVCKLSVVSLNWTRRGLWINLLLWETELETSLMSGSLGYSQPPQLTSGETDSIVFPYWRQTQEPALSRGTLRRINPGNTGNLARQTKQGACIFSSDPKASIKATTCRAGARDFWYIDICASGMVCPFFHKFKWTGGTAAGSILWILNLERGNLLSHLSKLICIPIVEEDTEAFSLYNFIFPVLETQLAAPNHLLPNAMLCIAHTLFKMIKKTLIAKLRAFPSKLSFCMLLKNSDSNRTTIPYSKIWNLTSDFLTWGICPSLYPNPHYTLLYLNCSHHLVHFLFILCRYRFLWHAL